MGGPHGGGDGTRLRLGRQRRALSRRLPSGTRQPLAGPLTSSRAAPRRSVVLHGHFYQPPREDPWTGVVPVEASAAPDSNWNERITRECYAPLARAGAFDWLSFDFGPTLLRWLERDARDVHDRVIEGDAASRARLGYGNAIAQPYHHIILPLASLREKRSEVRWGIDDFERRFGRRPAGMWLPETAVDRETLEVLAAEGIAFTILAPHQVSDTPRDGHAAAVALDGGRRIAVYVYDGAVAHGVAFGELLGDVRAWRDRLVSAGEPDRPVLSIATDGETFGHHHPGADRTLMEVIAAVEDSGTHRIENFAACLARTPAASTVELVEPSSWSCAHGVGRWRDDCGCKIAPDVDSQQAWRRPLREALEWLAAELDEVPAPDRGAMFTSCAWFFDDVGGLEPVQNLRYAAHAIDILSARDPDRAERLDRELAERLARALSNDPAVGDAGALYRDTVRREHPLGLAT